MEYKLTYDKYKEALIDGKFLGLQCKKCNDYTIPPKKVCMKCGSEDVDIVQVAGKGEIKTYTVIRVAPEGFEAPYIVAMVELVEGPWVMGNIIDMDPDKAGMDLIGKKVKIGHKVVAGDKFSAGDGVALTFKLEN
ncbi:MAG: Zn-ribbon domain-containing OB-fold protein [Thermodesulfobacteriota bacterium]|nr:Zn-ribbon domain-containing OB-fold protein [Thermodesulfobacteriota bacterium]